MEELLIVLVYCFKKSCKSGHLRGNALSNSFPEQGFINNCKGQEQGTSNNEFIKKKKKKIFPQGFFFLPKEKS